MSYAGNTTVSVEKSKGEIEAILRRYGASQFMAGWSDTISVIGFVIEGRQIKMTLPLPDPHDREFTCTPTGKKRSNEGAAERAWEQACRSRWRALLLVVKAKLEAVEVGISTVEEEFLAWTVVPGANGETVYDRVGPEILEAISSGRAPVLRLTGGK